MNSADSRPGGTGSPRDASVAVVGAGGLGTAAILALARAGIGKLTVFDPDSVEESNLHRQVLFEEPDLGRPKAPALRERVCASFPMVDVRAVVRRVESGDTREIFEAHDVVLDATDDPPTKFLLSDAAVLHRSALVTASAVGWRGYLLTVLGHRGPCLRCLFEEPPGPEEAPGCDVAGVLGPVPGVLGSLQAAEALKLVEGRGRPLLGRLLTYEGISGTFRIVEIDARSDCAACGGGSMPRSTDDVGPASPADRGERT